MRLSGRNRAETAHHAPKWAITMRGPISKASKPLRIVAREAGAEGGEDLVISVVVATAEPKVGEFQAGGRSKHRAREPARPSPRRWAPGARRDVRPEIHRSKFRNSVVACALHALT